MHLFKTIFRTVFAKGLGSVVNFLIVLLTARLMGAESKGEISLVVLNITVILLLSDVLGGGALVFLVPRYKLYSLLIPSWIWGVICGLLFPALFFLFGHMSQTDYVAMTLLSVFLNLSSINSSALNGKEKIRENNIVSLVQVFVLLGGLLYFIFLQGTKTPHVFYASLLLSYAISFLLSLYYLRKDIVRAPSIQFRRMMKQMIRSGFSTQVGNAVQLLNFRLSFYLLNHYFPFGGKAMVGVYSTAASICESVWVISNGIAMVQYARIANMGNRKEAQELTIALSKISFLATLLAVGIMLCLPSGLFVSLFTSEFIQLPYIIACLSAGICAFGLASMYSHYFSGIGKMHISATGSLVGFIVTLVLGFILVPRYGVTGAALTACCSYLSTATFLFIRFKSESGKGLVPLLFNYTGIFSSLKEQAGHVRN